MLTFGMEEEFVVLDPATLAPVQVAPATQRRLLAAGYAAAVVHRDILSVPN
ncbi:hypothetical protein ART_0323 [Arthrobacter sp. PAMC 25486]|uniref:hypothetical protein n=1 Tax=Arthrobacter sp. PAMC 25486 TaxID=1494608 RepID=UPI000535F4AB|nr:hypothetical protein [Arthrobacter sp. PAMC 25486]AIX99921.1 hypothetical protein ART_0323 [Arthrobacter sp. PAMC 25486]